MRICTVGAFGLCLSPVARGDREQVRAANIEAAEAVPEITRVAPKIKGLRSSR